MQMIVVLTTSA